MSKSVSELIAEHGGDNSAAYLELAQMIANRDISAFVGSGLSIELGYPSWDQLVEEAQERAIAASDHPDQIKHRLEQATDKTVRLDLCRDQLGEKDWIQLLKLLFRETTPAYGNSHVALGSMRIVDYYTTNYDPALECALNTDSSCSVVVFDLQHAEDQEELRMHIGRTYRKPACIYLHGTSRRPEKMIVTESDYSRAYNKEPATSKCFEYCMATRRFFFVGFGFNDEDLGSTLKNISRLFQKRHCHFALIAITKSQSKKPLGREDLIRKYGVKPIYLNVDEEFSQVTDFLRALADEVCLLEFANADTEAVRLPDRAWGETNSVTGQTQRAYFPRSQGSESDRLGILDVGANDRPEYEDAHDQLITSYFELATVGHVDQACEKLNDLLSKRGQDLTPRHRFRIHANIGNAKLLGGMRHEAIESYERAIAEYNESESSNGIQAYTFLLKGQLDLAYRYASAMCEKYPNSVRAHCVRLRTLPDGFSWNDCIDSVPEEIREKGEVALALAACAEDRQQRDQQEHYLRCAVDSEPEWFDALGALSSWLLCWLREDTAVGPSGEPEDVDPQRLQEIRELCDRALENTQHGADPPHIARVYINKSVCARMSGDADAARKLVATAYETAPEDNEIALVEALEREAEGNLYGALDCINGSAEKTFENDILRAQLYLRLGDKESKETAYQAALAILENEEYELKDAYIYDVSKIGLRAVGTDGMDGRIDRIVELGCSKLSSDTFQCMLKYQRAILRGESHQSSVLLDLAVQAAMQEDHWYPRQVVGVACESAGSWKHAMDIWRLMEEGVAPTDHVSRSIYAAARAQEWAYVLERCRQHRKNGGSSRGFLLTEVQALLTIREPMQAFELATEWCDQHQDDKEMTLLRATAAIHAHKQDLLSDSLGELPAVEDIGDPGLGHHVLHVLCAYGKTSEAWDYAYRLWRRWQEDQSANEILISMLIDQQAMSEQEMAPGPIEADSAVLLQEGDVKRWVFIESGPNPLSAWDEYPPTHAVSKALFGLRVGDQIQVGGREYQIKEVSSKPMIRASQLLEKYAQRFPASSTIREYYLPKEQPKSDDPREKIGKIYDVLRQDEVLQKTLESLHIQSQTPLAYIATRLGKSVFTTTLRYLLGEHLSVVACTSRDEYDAVLRRLHSCKTIVLDSTAVAVLFETDWLRHAWGCPVQFVVPISVLHEIGQEIIGLENGSLVHQIASVEGEPVRVENSKESLNAYAGRLRVLREELQQHCKIVGGEASTKMPVDIFESWSKQLGLATADAIAIAIESDYALWTEDERLARIVEESCRNRIFASAFLYWSMVNGYAPASDTSLAIQSLYDNNVVGVWITGQVVAETLKANGWDTSGERMRAIIDKLYSKDTRKKARAVLVMQLIERIWMLSGGSVAGRRAIEDILSRGEHDDLRQNVIAPMHSGNYPYTLRDIKAKKQLHRYLSKWG